MRAALAQHRHVRTLVRFTVVALLAGLLPVAAGAPAQAQPPNGSLDVITSPSAGVLYFEGWAYDADTSSAAVRVDFVVDGAVAWGVNAAEFRSDVGPHGFRLSLQGIAPGTRSVQVMAVDVQDGSRHLLGSTSLDVSDGTPNGAVDSVTAPADRTVAVAGWAVDPEAPSAPVGVDVYVGGPYTQPGAEPHNLQATVPRSDGLGFNSSFTTNKTGVQDVYVYAINAPGTPGGNRLIGTAKVTITADTTPPDTKITSIPKTATPSDVIKVTFSANEANATFECHWDGDPWVKCPSTTTISLTPGQHIISVRATDAAGNTDRTPASELVSITDYVTNPPPAAVRTLGVRAVKRKSKLRVNVGPDSASNDYAVVIQRKAGKKWRKVMVIRTRGAKDVAVINVRRGKYRAVLPKSASGPAMKSKTVRIKR